MNNNDNNNNTNTNTNNSNFESLNDSNNLTTRQYSKALNNTICIEYKLRVHKLKAFFKEKSSVFFLEIEVLILNLIVSVNKFHRTCAAWAKAPLPNVEQLTLGTDKRNCAEERRE